MADLKGGVAGGSILQGVLKVGDEIEVRPGVVTRDPQGRVKYVSGEQNNLCLFGEDEETRIRAVIFIVMRIVFVPTRFFFAVILCEVTFPYECRCVPIRSRIVSLYAEQNDLQFAVPGGLIGVGTRIDPTLCRADRLVGQVLGAVGKLPEIFTELEISYFLLRRLLGVKTEGDQKQSKVLSFTSGLVC